MAGNSHKIEQHQRVTCLNQQLGKEQAGGQREKSEQGERSG
jgi:hypothetical protein